MTTQPHPVGDVDQSTKPRQSTAPAVDPDSVAVGPGLLAWTARRGCITKGQELMAAVRGGEVVLAVDDDAVVRGIEGEAPLVAVVRIDNDTERLRQQIRDLSRRIDDLHHRLVDIAEASVEALVRR